MNQEQAKQKAIELVKSFISINGNSFFAKECALFSLKNEYDARIEVYESLYYYAPLFSSLKQAQADYELIKTEIEKL